MSSVSDFVETGKMDNLVPATVDQVIPERQNVVHRNDLFLKNGGTFTSNQLKLLLYVIAQLPRMLYANIPAVSIPLPTLMRLLNLNDGPAKRGERLRQILNALATVPAMVVDQEGGTIITTWFDFIRIAQDGQTYVFQFQPLLSPFFMQLNSQFTVYELGYVLKMTSIHSVRLYDTLKSMAYRRKVTIPMEDLKQYMGLVDYDQHGQIEKYRFPEFKKFNMNVLKPAMLEINEKTDLEITYEASKNASDRRKIDAIIFTIRSKENPPDADFVVPPSRYGKAELVYLDKGKMAQNIRGLTADNTFAIFRALKGDGANEPLQERADSG